MLTQLRLLLAQLIAPSGYEITDIDTVSVQKTDCFFRGKLSAFLAVRDEMVRLYGTDWRNRIYSVVDFNIKFLDRLINSSPDSN